MTTLDRAERVAAGASVAGPAGVGFLALVPGTPTASATGSVEAVGATVTTGAAGTAGTVGTTGAVGTAGAVGTTGAVGMMGGGGMMGGAGGFPFVFFPFMFVTFAALLAVGYAGVRALASAEGDDRVDEGADDDTLDPVARLKRRYTEGELTEAEFERALERELERGDPAVDGTAGETAAGRSATNRTATDRSATNRSATDRSATERER